MSWRKHENHREEQTAVKRALAAASINAKVGHGKGTAWGWLEINVGNGQDFGEHDAEIGHCSSNCPRCKGLRTIEAEALKIALKVTERSGDYNGEILILSQDAWDRKAKCSVPIEQKAYATKIAKARAAEQAAEQAEIDRLLKSAPPAPPAPVKVETEPEPAASEPATVAPAAPVLRLVKPEAEVPAPAAPVPVEAPPSATHLVLAALVGEAEASALLSTYGSLRALARSPDAPQAVRAALRFARALDAESGLPTATDAGAVAAYYAPRIGDSTTERFHALLLDSANHIVRDTEIVRGGLTSCSVLPREAFAPALREGAVAVIFVHNHPSGATAPSADDIALTRKLVQAGGILGIKVLDHVIVGAGFTSLRAAQPSLFAV